MSRGKITTVEELAGYVRSVEPSNIVLAHGVFDILHPGHIRHLQAARGNGDRLWVTITADQYVNKGPGHPYNAQHLRAEQVAALECVEYVAVHNGAAAPLEQLRPHVYAKGGEYKNPENDLTGKIVTERAIVEGYGGRIVFTDEITFSSSEIFNRAIDGVYAPPLRNFLKQYRAENVYPEIMDLIATIGSMTMVVVGELILDHYIYVTPLGKPPKENILAVRYLEEETFAGGVIAAANHLAGFVREVRVVTAIGDDRQYIETLALVKRSLLPNVKLRFTLRDDEPTTRKTRLVDKSYTRKLSEIYTDGPPQYAAKTQNYISEDISKALEGADGLIVLDYGHGMFMPKVRDACDKAKFLAINTQANAGNYGFNAITKYNRANYICLDAPEARLAQRDRIGHLGYIIESLAHRIECDKIIITTGAEGCITFDRKIPRIEQIPAFTGRVVDTMGAGDAFFVITAPMVATGGRMDFIGFVGNAVGALKVGVVGHRESVKKIDLIRAIGAVLR
jgi:cytidyltransferase-like protein